MICEEQPPLAGVYIAHFGVRGMHWGHRKSATKSSRKLKPRDFKKTKRLIAAGAIATAAILYKQGKLKSTSLKGLSLTATGISWVGGHLFTAAVNTASVGYDVVRLFSGGTLP